MLQKILILGAGYGGLTAAVNLQRELSYGEAEITLVNKHKYHYIATHLHQSAAGTTNAKRLKIELAELIDPQMINMIKDEVTAININEKKVFLRSNQVLTYDILVIALGSEVETFGIKGLRDYSFAIRSINSVQLIREHIDYMFAKYKGEKSDPKYLTFIIGGAGFTGIEFVGELVDRIPQLCEQFDVNEDEVEIVNIEAASKPLPGFDPKLVDYAVEVLSKKGVKFIMNTPIKECNQEGVVLENGDALKSSTVIWTGGIRGNKIIENIGLDNINARVKVDDFLRAPGYKDIFVIGDNSIVFDENGKPYPPTAQIAIQQGEHVAKQIISYVKNEKMTLKKFTFNYRGTLASLGRGIAIGKIGKWKVAGLTASFLKQMVDNRYLYTIGGIQLLLKRGKIFD